MAFTQNTLAQLNGGFVEGSFKVWLYTSADALNVVTAPAYFSNGGYLGMAAGDLVLFSNPAAPLTAPAALLQVASVGSAVVGGFTQATTATVQLVGIPASAFSANPRNLIDGGDFTTNPFQRGATFTAIANTLTYTADRWFALGGASSSISVSQQAQTDVVGFGNSLRFGRGGGTDTAVIKLGQVIETADSIRAQGQVVTVSFWAKAGAQFSAASAAILVNLVSGTGSNQSAANLAAGSWTGSTSLTLTPLQGAAAPAANIAQPITTAAVRYVFTATVPATATQLGLVFSYAPTGTNNTTDTVDFYGVQVEIAPQATLFEHLDVQMVLEICQRYFWQVLEPAASVVLGIGQATTTTAATVQINLPVQMRVAPTTVVATRGSMGVTVAAGTNQALTAFTANAAGHTANAIGLTCTVAANLIAGNATQLIGNGGAGLVSASCDF